MQPQKEGSLSSDNEPVFELLKDYEVDEESPGYDPDAEDESDEADDD